MIEKSPKFKFFNELKLIINKL